MHQFQNVYSKVNFLIKKIFVFSLFKKQTEREAHKNLATNGLFHICPQIARAGLKPETQLSNQVSHMCAGTEPFLLPSGLDTDRTVVSEIKMRLNPDTLTLGFPGSV